jgi:hypothetical protein
MIFTVFGFERKEKLIITVTLLVIVVLGFFNFKAALRRKRDFQRKEDVRSITVLVELFKVEYGFYPETENGQLKGCSPTWDKLGVPHFQPCVWGQDVFSGRILPGDPLQETGFGYLYLATAKHYQVLAALEGVDEAEYDLAIVQRNLACGRQICNFGLGNAPLAKSLKEYENEISE